MIHLNGKPWEDYDGFLKRLFGPNLPKFNKNLVFVVTERYKGLRKMGDGKGEIKWKESTAESSPLPIEFTTYVDGKSVVLRYVERVEKRVEQSKNGPTTIEIEHPGSMYIQKGKFEVKKHKFELWVLLMLSPYCENGFYYDTRPLEGTDGKKNVWGMDMKEVLYNVANRGVMPTYKHSDATVILKAKLADEDKVFKAQKHIRDSSEKDLRDMYAALGQPDSQTEEIEVIQMYLLELAKEPAISSSNKSGADKIFGADSKTISYKSTVVQAEQCGAIVYTKMSRAWRFDGEKTETICLVPKGLGQVDYLVEWLRSKDDGGEVFAKIKEGIRAAELAEQT